MEAVLPGSKELITNTDVEQMLLIVLFSCARLFKSSTAWDGRNFSRIAVRCLLLSAGQRQ